MPDDLLVQQLSSLRAMLTVQGAKPDTLADFDSFISKLTRDMEAKNVNARSSTGAGTTGAVSKS